MRMGVVRDVITKILECVLHTVAHNIKSHEANEHRQGKACQHICSLKTEWMLQAASLPDFKVGHDVYRDADSGAGRIEE